MPQLTGQQVKQLFKIMNKNKCITSQWNFLGRLLVNNMMNLGIYEIAKEGLEDYGINIHDLEEL